MMWQVAVKVQHRGQRPYIQVFRIVRITNNLVLLLVFISHNVFINVWMFAFRAQVAVKVQHRGLRETATGDVDMVESAVKVSLMPPPAPAHIWAYISS